jgi:hypothetical protein
MKKVLHFLHKIGLLAAVPESMPKAGTVLARSRCFLHDGDNPNAFLLFADGFACCTAKCHADRELGRNLPGLIRHMARRLTGRVMPWREAWRYATTHVEELRGLVGEAVRHAHASRKERGPVDWTAEDLAACLKTPDPYYISRGYRPETLAHFGVGRCVKPLPDGKDTLIGWSIFPVLDWRPPYPPAGYTARNPRYGPGGASVKWIHAVSPLTNLFNVHALRGGLVKRFFICEGPGCVMRLHEAGYPDAVATLGKYLTDGQCISLEDLSLDQGLTIYAMADNDDSGRGFAEQVHRETRTLSRHEAVKLFPPQPYKDIGDMPTEEAMRWLKEVL